MITSTTTTLCHTPHDTKIIIKPFKTSPFEHPTNRYNYPEMVIRVVCDIPQETVDT
jgi:hypothetical protein